MVLFVGRTHNQQIKTPTQLEVQLSLDKCVDHIDLSAGNGEKGPLELPDTDDSTVVSCSLVNPEPEQVIQYNHFGGPNS